MEFRQIELKDKQIFDDFLKRYPPKASEYTFTNFFCWRLTKKYEFAVVDDHLVVRYENKMKFLQPVGNNPAEIIKMILKEHPNATIERVESSVAEKLNAKRDRDNDDYIYSLQDMRELKGDKYTPKRNFINRMEKNSPKIELFTEKCIPAMLKLQEEWCDMRKCNQNPGLYAEDLAVREAITHFVELKLFAVKVIIGEKVEAFAIGEQLNENTFVEHFEKGNTKIAGTYQYVLNAFAKNIPDKFEFLNREQDLGIEGIRKAKESYYPSMMVGKYKISN